MKVAGFQYHYNAPFHVDTKTTFDIYRNTFHEFGLGVKTGVDLPMESIGNVGSDHSPDLLLNYVIGQYDTYTTMQLSQYINTIAANGNRMKPHFLKEVYSSATYEPLNDLIMKVQPVVLNKLTTYESYLDRIQEGFREVMRSGLGKNFMGNSPFPAGKTGTSESFMDTNGDGIIDTPTLSNAFVGYAPFDNPLMSIAITYPNIVNGNSNSSRRSYANITITRKISEKFFEMYPLNVDKSL
jgi:cell division protein FtsI/penicillin-binding protein 2